MAKLGVRDEFVNTTPGWVGAVQIAHNGEQTGVAVPPHGNVWLTEDEQILTANAPKADEDNPFIERMIPAEDGEKARIEQPVLVLRTRGQEIKSRRPFGAQAQDRQGIELPADGVEREVEIEETGAPPLPEGEPAEGSRPPGEEVATPVTPEGKRRRKTTTV